MSCCCKKIPLIWKITIGFVLGLIAGLVIGPLGDAPFVTKFFLPLCDLLGKVFLALLKMLIVPLVFSSLIVGAASIGDPKTLGRIGIKTVLIYLLTTLFAVTLGLILANLIHPGIGLSIAGAAGEAKEAQKMVDVILNVFPSNPLQSLVNGAMLQIIVFALFLGVAAALLGEKAKAFVAFNEAMAEVMYKVTEFVMAVAPFGVFGLITITAAKYGLSVLAPFAKVIFCVYVGCALQAILVYSGLIGTVCHKSPAWFFGGVKEAMLTSFVTRSSAATIPVSTKNVQALGVSERVSAFVLPLGATINMDGTAIYQGVCALFIAEAFGIPLSISTQIGIIATATLASIGTAGVPGAGLIMLSMVLAYAGLPIEGLGLVAGIDVVLDMARTCINVTGDMCTSCVVAKTEGETLN